MTNAILEADRQARWRLRKEQGTDKPKRSAWVVTRFRRYLRPEDVATAHHLAGLWATAEGVREMHDFVDAQSSDRHIIARIAAIRDLHGFEQAARTRLSNAAAKCMWAIAYSDDVPTTAKAMGFHPKSTSACKKLCQLTLMTLSEYWDETKQEADRWNRLTV